MTGPKIGEPRLCDGPTLPVLYPGEKATAASVAFDGTGFVVTSWMVEPQTGWYGLFLRWRYRLLGGFGGEPHLIASVTVAPPDPPHERESCKED